MDSLIDFQSIIQKLSSSPQGSELPHQGPPSYAVDYNLVPSATDEYLQSRVGGALLALRRKK